MNETQHKVAVIGSGFQARNLAMATTRTPQLTLQAVHGTNAETVAALAEATGARVETELRTILEDPEIGMVVVATPNPSHADLAAQALIAGKAVFVEKPLALRGADLDMLAGLTADEPHRLIVGHTLRTAPGILRMIEEVRAGEIGTLLNIEAQRSRILRMTSTGWKHDPMLSGGELIHEIHELDLACLLGGEVSAVSTLASPADGRSAEPPLRHSLIAFTSGAIAHHLIASGDHRARWALTASGSLASLHADLREGTVTRLEAGVATGQWPVFDEPSINQSLVESSQGPARHNPPGTPASPWMAALAQHEMAEVARILNGARDSILLHDPTAGLRAALSILEAESAPRTTPSVAEGC